MAEQPNQNVFGLLTENPNRIYVIAEAGLNHGGNKERALALVRAAKWAGAEEIEHAIDWMHTQSNEQVVLLHCVSSYPAKQDELNLKSLQYLRDRFGVPVGFSDHSVGTLGSVVATSLGAQVIERHFMIETRGETPDHAVSMDAKTLKGHIEELRTIGSVLGERDKFAGESETKNKTAS